MQKSLDVKLARLRQDPAADVFILADAKDADMGFGLSAPGPAPPGSKWAHRSLAEYRELMRQVVQAGDIDLMLMSASSSEILTIEERIFDRSHVTPAVRANDTSDIWLGTSARYHQHPSVPFRSATIDHIQCGRLACGVADRLSGANLGLYSLTLNHDVERDTATLQAYREFRLEAEARNFRHFLEVFAPNAPQPLPGDDVGRFVNDSLARLLAGVTRAARPIFLKIPYFGPAAMEALCHYDSTLVVGILGGSAGTVRDAFQLLHDARRYGARAALFGRKINVAEDQISFVRCLRGVADGALDPVEATRAYHGELARQGFAPSRSLEADLELTDPVLRGS